MSPDEGRGRLGLNSRGGTRSRIGKESEKKERWPDGKLEMRRRRRGSATDGHMEEHTSCQRLSSPESACSCEDAQAAEARAGPSRRARMWARMMSGWRAEIVSPP